MSLIFLHKSVYVLWASIHKKWLSPNKLDLPKVYHIHKFGN